jgi:tetratricopeptide (TPR) repeat protein
VAILLLGAPLATQIALDASSSVLYVVKNASRMLRSAWRAGQARVPLWKLIQTMAKSLSQLYYLRSRSAMVDQTLAASLLPDFNTLWDYSNPAQTQQKLSQLLPLAESSENRSYLAELLTQIARAQGLQRHFDQAHATLDRAQQLLTDDSHVARIRCVLERGRLFNDSQQLDPARQMFLKAWELGWAHKIDEYAVDAAHMLGIIEPPQQALEWNLTAITYASASSDPAARRWLATLNNNLGWTYVKLDRLQDALAAFQESLRLRRQQGNKTTIRIAQYQGAAPFRARGRSPPETKRHRGRAESGKRI